MRPGSPSVEWSWRYDAGAKKVEVSLAQTQPGEPYRLPLDISVGGKLQRIELASKAQTYTFAAEGAPAAVELDPNLWVLMDGKQK